MLPTYPSIMSRPFAAGGDKTAIPDTTDAPGRASLAEGFPVLTQTPLTAGGVPPSRLDFNGILNLLSQFAFWQQSGGMHNWSAELSYAPPAMVWGSDARLYRCVAASGPDVPGVGAKDPVDGADPAYWQDYAAGIASSVPKGLVAPFYKVTFGGSDGRRPVFWGKTTPDEGWVLCDGQSDGAGGTVPDLRDRMIIGAGTTYASGSKGGNSMHSHSLSGTVGATTLDGNTLPYHSHEGAIRHGNSWDESSGWYSGHPNFVHPGLSATGYAGGSQPHTHSLSASTGTDSSLPPYYALAYIMKL